MAHTTAVPLNAFNEGIPSDHVNAAPYAQLYPVCLLGVVIVQEERDVASLKELQTAG